MTGFDQRGPEDFKPFALPDIGEAEVEAVSEVLRSRWLTTGAKTRAFEESFASAVGSLYAVALNSCTAALHLSLEAFGVGPGDLVYVPTYTFAATAEVVRYLGATPVLVDVEESSFNIDVADLRRRIEQNALSGMGRPRAIIPVHFAGVACDLDEIYDVAREHGLVVVEDAAHAFPASYAQRPVGWTPEDVPTAVCFSFYATKTITTGEGGMVVTRDSSVADRIRLMSLHGLSKEAWNRYTGGSWRYDILEAGYKYNLTDIASAMGLVQLQRAQSMRDRREAIALSYQAAFEGCPLLRPPDKIADRSSAWHLYPLRLSDPLGEAERDVLIERLRSDYGVGTSVHFIPLHMHSFYSRRSMHENSANGFPVATNNFRHELSLPIYSTMSEDDVERVIEGVLSAVRQL